MKYIQGGYLRKSTDNNSPTALGLTAVHIYIQILQAYYSAKPDSVVAKIHKSLPIGFLTD